jgi:hypothetical protein
MTAHDLYHELIVQGFSLSVNGGKLDLAPSTQLTDNLRAQIRTYKADLMALLASNDHYETIVISEVSTNGENLKPTTEKLAVEMQGVFPSSNHYPKRAVESIRLTQSEEAYPHIEDGQPTFSMDRYAHMVKCQQCEHLTSTGYCRVKPQYKPMPEAMRDCVSFDALKTERISIVNKPYTQSELHDLISLYEKKLFHHLVDCMACSFMESRYCVDAFAIGSSYDALLMAFEDAASKREALLNAVVRARISGRKAFVGLDYTNIGKPQQQAVKPLVYGIGDSERLFVNHLMVCDKCKPASRTYCADGLQLKANADSNSV